MVINHFNSQFPIAALYLALFACALMQSCASPPKLSPEGPVWRDADDKPIPEPQFHEPSLVYTAYIRTGPEQLRELLDIDRNIRKLSGRPTQAKNTNSYDEVPNSSWFTNRHGYQATELSSEQIRNGMSLTSGPDTSAPWKVFRPKLGGATLGFWIEDSGGDQYLIKFDPPGNPELATAAAAMGSRFFFACGYNVPQETIVHWKPSLLTIKDGAKIKNPDGTKRSLTQADLETMLANVHQEPDGTIRSLASLNLGSVKGPFSYDGVNKNDPNDWCPHQHRRELRALRVIGSLINHYDLKDHNSMDVYHGEPNQGYLKHYLMDFGSTFGSDGRSVKEPRKGYANIFDLRDALVSTVTLGTKTWGWESAKEPLYPSIGYFESEIFEPQKFDPIIPNPAFEQMTHQDAYWGAKIVMAFDDSDLRALIDAGEYSNPEASAHLLQILKERQEKIGRHWFSKVNPLDFPRIKTSDKELEIGFDDLWIKAGLGKQSSHEFSLESQGRKLIDHRPTKATAIILNEDDLKLMRSNSAGYFEIEIYSTRDGHTWKRPMKFTLRLVETISESKILSIKHPG